MFPNDDICNVDAARNAAQRLFKRYKKAGDKTQEPAMGKSEVNRLMKATYQAIGMQYKPDQEDVFSFMSVFDSNNDGKIELKDIEQLAVKYLCGEDALGSMTLEKIEEKPQNKAQKGKQSQSPKPKKEESNLKSLQERLKLLKVEETQQKSNLVKVNYPKAYQKPQTLTTYSPRSRVASKQSISSTTFGSQVSKNPSFDKQNSSEALDELHKQGKTIFDKHRGNSTGITEASAPKVITETYQLFGKKNFKPNKDDVQIWMKLCDRNRDGLVDWDDLKYFIQRTYERNQNV